mmetsp:Transcript_11506/g.20733  ORF Transcript_11506/g.20733 Transcript_11506/m.20733 type:complete len:120 (+) Transcript_11506:19-378(+)
MTHRSLQRIAGILQSRGAEVGTTRLSTHGSATRIWRSGIVWTPWSNHSLRIQGLRQSNAKYTTKLGATSMTCNEAAVIRLAGCLESLETLRPRRGTCFIDVASTHFVCVFGIFNVAPNG